MQLSDRIGGRVKLQDLHILMTVVEARSIGKAAKLLNSTQPAISRSITEFERALGVRLLDRYRHGIEPTEHARVLLECSVAVFDDLRQGLKNIKLLSSPSSGDVRIGSTSFLAESFVTTVIDRISRQYPCMTFHLVTAPTETLQRELHSRKLDFLIVRRFGAVADDRLDFEYLFDDSFVVAAGSQNQWVDRRKIKLHELTEEPWVLPPPESAMGSVALEVFRLSGLDFPRVTVTAGLPSIRTRLLLTGRFLTIFPTCVLRFPTTHSDIRVLPVQLPVACVPDGIATLKNRTISPAAQLFIAQAREVAKMQSRAKVW